MKTPALSICIPTYNRGQFAYEAVRHVLDNWAGDEIEVVISDNNSSDNTEKLIKGISDGRLKYFRNDVNLGAAYNTHLSFLRACGEFAYLTSDEDDIRIEELPYLLNFLNDNPDVSVFIGGGDLSYTKKRFPDATYTSPFDALKAVAFQTRYMTGIILNQRKYARQLGGITLKESAEKWDAYSFMYAIARLCCFGKVVTSPRLLFSQPRLRMTDVSNNARKDGIYYYEPQGRINQMHTWSQAVCELPIGDFERKYMVIKIVFDTVELATRIFSPGYVEEVRKTVPAQDFEIYQQRISSLDMPFLSKTILDDGNALFLSLFGCKISDCADPRLTAYYAERIDRMTINLTH